MTGAGGAAGEGAAGAIAQAAPAAVAGNPVLSDVAYQIEPWLLHLRRELRAGRAPWWNPYQYAGTPFWSNGQSAPLFPLHLLFAALPLQAGLVLLPWLKVMIAGLGARALARELGLPPAAALLAGLIYPLSGMLAGFVLYPMGSALALVPWVLWAVERLAAGRSGPLPLAAAAGLQLLAGHPETALHTALLSGLYLLVRGTADAAGLAPAAAPGGEPAAAGRPPALRARVLWTAGRRPALRVWAGWAVGWTLGAGLAAVQLVPLAIELVASARWQAEGAGFAEPLGRLLAQPLRLVLPELYGDPARGTWWGPYNYLATAVYAGALALPLAAAGLGRIRGGGRATAGSSDGVTGRARPGAEAGAEAVREPGGQGIEPVASSRWDRRWLAVAAVLGFSVAAAYHLPGVREALAALPLVGRAAHHRLIFGVELALALLAAAGWERWRRGGGGRGPAAGALAAGLMLAAAWALHAGEWAARGLTGRQAAWTAWAAAAALLLLAGRRLPERPRRALALALPAIFALDLLAAHGRINPGLPLERLYPETPAVRFLQERAASATGAPGRIAATGATLRPNAAMVYGLHDVRGDDTVKPARWTRFEAEHLGAGHPNYFTPIRRWDPAWLDLLAVRWVMTPPGEPPPAGAAEGGWRLEYDGADARVWERAGPLPRAWWRGEVPSATVEVREAAPGRIVLSWEAPRRALLVVSERHDRGWTARSGGRELPVVAAADVLLGVELGPGEGELELVYRPPGIGWGAAASAAASAVVLAMVVLRRRARRTSPEQPR